jgi:hypothetical protein
LLLRFILGGSTVSLFAVAGGAWKPKTFAGIFGAAPSMAMVSLAIAYVTKGKAYVAVETRSMMLGAVALLAYSGVCVVIAKRRDLRIGVGAVLAWLVWLAVALSLFMLFRQLANWSN